ncbi:MAG: hypothetical protein DRP46_13185 [Candidatus Zixiibacteriota bacterium]|nr:MAG: hypothetical protein DRP46_13185 [candidate division Zixibacteria bacterium]
MKKKLTIFTFVTLLCVFASVSAAPQAYSGRVFLENKVVAPGESFILKVSLADSDIGLTSLRVPLKFDSRYLTCNYVDFGNSIKDASMQGYYSVNGDHLDISYIPSVVSPLPEIQAESGEIASIYFTVDVDAPSMMIIIDSLNEDIQFEQFNTVFHKWRRVEAADQSGISPLAPGFTPGVVSIDRGTSVDDNIGNILPDIFSLDQNYPNPFNPNTSIAFSLPFGAHVKLEVFNVLGQVVEVLADEDYPAGNHELLWDASLEPSGIYFYRLTAGAETITRKMMLLK